MKSYMKYASFLFLGFFLLTSVVYAEDGENLNIESETEIKLEDRKGSDLEEAQREFRDSIRVKREALNTSIKESREDIKDDNDANEDDSEDVDDEDGDDIDDDNDDQIEVKSAYQLKMEAFKEEVKKQREEFKKEFEFSKEVFKEKMNTSREEFKKEIEKIKDEKKKLSADIIFNSILALNIKLTDHLSDKLNQIDNVLVSVESRISKAKERGLDVSVAEAQAIKAHLTITAAREAIVAQAAITTYNVTVGELTLKSDMKAFRDTFKADIKSVEEKVKLAHIEVRNTATILAKIPTIDDDENDNEEDANDDETDTNDTDITN